MISNHFSLSHPFLWKNHRDSAGFKRFRNLIPLSGEISQLIELPEGPGSKNKDGGKGKTCHGTKNEQNLPIGHSHGRPDSGEVIGGPYPGHAREKQDSLHVSNGKGTADEQDNQGRQPNSHE